LCSFSVHNTKLFLLTLESLPFWMILLFVVCQKRGLNAVGPVVTRARLYPRCYFSVALPGLTHSSWVIDDLAVELACVDHAVITFVVEQWASRRWQLFWKDTLLLWKSVRSSIAVFLRVNKPVASVSADWYSGSFCSIFDLTDIHLYRLVFQVTLWFASELLIAADAHLVTDFAKAWGRVDVFACHQFSKRECSLAWHQHLCS
jgi:hypothetical protein